MPQVTLYFASGIVALLAVLLFLRKKQQLPYPPGPKGLPLIGNIRDLPSISSSPWITYAKWSRELDSDLIHLNLAGTHLLIVNTLQASTDLFEKRSTIYSDRPRLPMLTELAKWDWTFGLFGYGDKWRLYRRLFHQYFNNSAVRDFEPQQRKATHEFLHRLVETPEDFINHIRLEATSLILSVAYGLDIQSVDHPIARLVEEFTTSVGAALNPGSFLVDALPILKYVPEWMPGAGFKKMAKKWRKCFKDTADIPFDIVKDQMAKGISPPSVASLALEKIEGNNDEQMEEAIRGVSGVVYGAGSDTAIAALYSFVLAIVLHPEAAKKAQEELDRVVGRDRLPDFFDRPSLPYICALIKEVLRWHPVAPLGVAHRSTVDDIYDGKFIPAGSILVGNVWSMLHDENVYSEPEKFNPDRFLKDGKLDPDVRAPEVAAFGFGRRICPGRYFADSAMFMNIACMLSVFDIGYAVDANGNNIVPSGEFQDGFVCHPVPFKCSIKPRSRQALSVITDTYATYHP